MNLYSWFACASVCELALLDIGCLKPSGLLVNIQTVACIVSCLDRGAKYKSDATDYITSDHCLNNNPNKN